MVERRRLPTCAAKTGNSLTVRKRQSTSILKEWDGIRSQILDSLKKASDSEHQFWDEAPLKRNSSLAGQDLAIERHPTAMAMGRSLQSRWPLMSVQPGKPAASSRV